ncbi:MAG TPA: PLP-dependent transferase, partial [Candidatus Binataceae bacterium]|nr:PLP-dependent transferase [Candidatus Binataceae bacterium]
IGRADLIEEINRTLSHLGGSLDPHACFLLHRGLKTLGVRVRYQNASALALARYLAAHPKVAAVNYPGLESDPGQARARELFDGCGGMMSFELRGGVAAAEAFINGVTIPISAPSLGGVESLITRPVKTSHSGMPRAERERAGIGEGLIRLSVGLEATADLMADFGRALEAC